MHDFHEHLTKQLAEHLAKRTVVVWYDPRREFAACVAEISGGTLPDTCRLDTVTLHSPQAPDPGPQVTLCVADGSLYEAKFLVEPLVNVDQPLPLVIYVPGQLQDPDISPLAELELGGTTWQPQLKCEARRVLKARYGDGQIDQMLQSDNVTYADIVGLLSEEAGGGRHHGTLLSVIFAEARGDNAGVLAD